MHAVQSIPQTLLSLSIEGVSIREIRNELRSFGLNPNDWQALHAPRVLRESRLILVHREDKDLRISVNMHPVTNLNPRTRIAAVEMLL